MDDKLFFSSSVDQMIEKLDMVFTRLANASFVNYLGHSVLRV